jgi:hypothetical protein
MVDTYAALMGSAGCPANDPLSATITPLISRLRVVPYQVVSAYLNSPDFANLTSDMVNSTWLC